MKKFIPVAICTGLILGCGGGGSGSAQPTPSPIAGVALERVTNSACLAPEDSSSVGDVSLVQAFPNLPRLGGLLGMFQEPGNDTQWYALLREGRVLRFANSAQASEFEVFLDIRASVRTGGEMGLLGFAFHPQFTDNGEFFVYYSDDEDSGASTVSRFVDNGANLPVSASTEEAILRLSQPASNHNGGAIGFGPDGMLYIGFGDGGGANDTFGNGQNTQTWHGSLLRIDVDSAAPYAVPPDNPYVSEQDVLPEIYAFGLRNPWRWSFDRQTGALWLADVGQGAREEVNIVASGDNLGWPRMEGSQCFGSDSCDQDGLVLPVAEYSHSNGDCSVSGGYVYRGAEIPALYGSYFYADYCTGRIRRTFAAADATWETEEVLVSGRNIAAFAQDNAGEVYALDNGAGAGNEILRITADGDALVPGTPPQQLSDTGCFSSLAAKVVAPGVVPYEVKSGLWSDGVAKQRYFAIPNTARIGLSEHGEFDFPVGTVLIKSFVDGDRFLETRLLAHQQSGWRGYSYEWNEAGNQALLLDDGKIIESEGKPHVIPSRDECFVCHTSTANFSLGLEAGQLDGDFLYPSGEVANQLSALVQAGYLAAPPNLSQTSELAALDDGDASVALRARSYLQSNCSGCHRPNAAGSLLDLRIHTALSNTGACNQAPASGDLDIDNAMIIAAGDSARSVLLARMQDLGEDRMPSLATLEVDEAAIAVIAQWIDELDGCGG